ncbi:MAG: glutamate--tRNA ligase, partial [Hyphomicrobiales bacterium]|nr:glutamate--tRNA ligase [Hyphomicrobiales bacterium]
MNPPIVRFAPSPTGMVHVGNARTALYNWLFAKPAGGSFILRFDDTDRERSRTEFADAILTDLNWLGIEPDRIERQSARFESYDAAARKLKAAGLLYACYETPDELDRQRARRRARGLPPVYDRRALKLGEAEKAELEGEGRRPHWRFLLPNHDGDPLSPRRTDVAWQDLFRGEQSIDLASMSDPVLVRVDGSYLYTLPSVVDDIAMRVTHVLRGDDHVTNTGAQIALFEALDAGPPAFGHHNLLQATSGEGLSKRDSALSIAALREDGLEAAAIAAYATLIGTSEPVRPVHDLAGLAEIFRPDIVNKAATRFSPDELRHLNAKLLAELPHESVTGRLQDAGVGGGEAFWLAVRGNLERLEDAKIWWQVVTGPIEPVVTADDMDFLASAASALPPEPWDQDTWRHW